MKNAYLPKVSILLQFGGEILALLCPGDSIQILLILSQFLTFGTLLHYSLRLINVACTNKSTVSGYITTETWVLCIFYDQDLPGF